MVTFGEMPLTVFAVHGAAAQKLIERGDIALFTLPKAGAGGKPTETL